ncbi:hypothetical protein [Caldimonas tepidiphila]|uniref:hypothetical protein n=1 Tax=Caldimonas tepidiphila TaxID=2315841 RepID=UPI0013005479|nr:hypothetical protein [Caldimonas tepidiphila]
MACPALGVRNGAPRRASRRTRCRAAALGAMLMLGAAAQAEPPALTMARADLAPLRSFLERSSGPQPGSTGVIELRRADLDADGRDELVMLWGLFGATSSWPALTVFRQGPQGWREAGTQDLEGQVERLELRGREIRLELRVPDPDDPRCCPSRGSASRYRWDGARLVEAR